MYLDSITVAALADEFAQQLVGGRVQDSVQIDDLSLGLEIYAHRQRHYLLLSAEASTARACLLEDKLRRGVDHPSPIGLQLRKYVEGARINAVAQPPWERVLWIDFSGDEGDTRLVIELMDKRSNIILTDGDTVLEAIKRVGPDVNRYRVTLPGKPYIPPPPIRKLHPDAASDSDLRAALAANPDGPAWKALVDGLAGISPLCAREIIFRACGDHESPAFDLDAEPVHAALRELIDEVLARRWRPCVVPAPEVEGYLAFAAYPLTHMEHWEPAERISAAISLYFGAPVGLEAYAPAKQGVAEQLEDALDRAQRKLSALQREAASPQLIEDLRLKGEMILAYSSTLHPKQSSFEAEYSLDGPPLHIELDPELTAVENAQAYFARYDKARRAQSEVPRLLEAGEQEVAYLEQLQADLALAESWPEIDAVREALQDGGYWQGPRRKAPASGKPGIRRFTTPEGVVVLVGRNAAQNHELVTEKSGRDDLWLHARGKPGSHVIIRNDGRPIPDSVIRFAAELAAYYSAGQAEARVQVDITERRHVRPIRGGRPGMVTYQGERTITVTPRKPKS